MRKQILYIVMLVTALAYAVYSYWPLFSVYLPEFGGAPASRTAARPDKVGPAVVPKLPSRQISPAGKKTATLEVVKVSAPETQEAKPKKVRSKEEEEVEAAAEKIVRMVNEAKKPVSKKPERLVDPFALRIDISSRAEAEARRLEIESGGGPRLEGIWVDAGMRVAFISGQAVSEGAMVQGWRVSRITKTQVLLIQGRKKKTLKLEAILK